jgi:pilus assembly protein CpaE
MSDRHIDPIRIYITGACTGLAEARDALAAHTGIELAGTASEPGKAATRLAATGPHVVVHALDDPDLIGVDDIEQIRAASNAPIVLLTTRSSPALLEEALRHEIADVVLLPQMVDNLVFSIRKAATLAASTRTSRDSRPPDRCTVITLFSPKGGTGKTTLAANLGAASASIRNQRTLVIDLDLQFGDLAISVGAEPKNTILDLVMAHGELDADKLRGFVTHHESGMDILPAPLRPEDAELVTDDRLASVIAAARNTYDVIIIDTPPNFNSTVLTALDRTDHLLLVASLDIPAIKSVKVCLQTLDMLRYPADRCHVVLNRSDAKVGLRRQDVEQVLGRTVAFSIPSSKSVPTSLNFGVPFVVREPKADVSKALVRACAELVPEAPAAHAPQRTRASRRKRRHAAAQATSAAAPVQLDLGLADSTEQAA